MSALLSQLQPAMRGFFVDFFTDKPEAESIEALRDQVGAELEITIGRYAPFSGFASSINGHRLLPRYAVHVERELVYFAGAGRGITFYQAQLPPPPEGQPPLQTPPPYQYTLVRVDERVDPLTDDRDTMVRLFATMRAEAPGAEPPGEAAAAAWADAIVAQVARDPSVFEIPLSVLDQLPEGMPAASLDAYKRVMFDHATYFAGSGEYYPKRNQSVAGEGNLPIEFPEGTTVDYCRINTRELTLEPNTTYCLVNLPDGWGTGIDRQNGAFREIVFKLRPVEAGGFEHIPISWATRIVQWGSSPARDFYDFCFFVTGDLTAGPLEPIPDEVEAPPPA